MLIESFDQCVATNVSVVYIYIYPSYDTVSNGFSNMYGASSCRSEYFPCLRYVLFAFIHKKSTELFIYAKLNEA